MHPLDCSRLSLLHPKGVLETRAITHHCRLLGVAGAVTRRSTVRKGTLPAMTFQAAAAPIFLSNPFPTITNSGSRLISMCRWLCSAGAPRL